MNIALDKGLICRLNTYSLLFIVHVKLQVYCLVK